MEQKELWRARFTHEREREGIGYRERTRSLIKLSMIKAGRAHYTTPRVIARDEFTYCSRGCMSARIPAVIRYEMPSAGHADASCLLSHQILPFQLSSCFWRLCAMSAHIHVISSLQARYIRFHEFTYDFNKTNCDNILSYTNICSVPYATVVI